MKNLFKLQKLYNDKIYKNSSLDLKELEVITQSLGLCAHAELSELISATRYKKHHADHDVEVDKTKILYESVDVIRYIMAILNLWEIDSDSFENAFMKKDTYLNERKRIDDNPWQGQPVAIVDMDDVLVEFRTGFAKWLNVRKNIFPDVESKEYYFIDALAKSGENPEGVFEEFIADHGFCDWLEPNPDAKNFLSELKEAGYWIHILTARPDDNLNCFYDTFDWLNRHNLYFDDISFSAEKFRWCAKSKYYDAGAIKFAIDDSPKHATEYATHGLLCYVPKKPYNEKQWNINGVVPYDTFSDLLKYLNK